MEKPTYPIKTKTETEFGWIFVSDYGPQGKSVSYVYRGQGTPEEAEKNRANLNRVLGRMGYQLAGAEA